MLRIATFDDYDEVYRVGLIAANYQPYEVDHGKLHKLLNMFLTEPNEKSIILLYDDNGTKALLAARIEENIYHKGKIAAEVLWWVDPANRNPNVVKETLAAFEFWARKMKCSTIGMTAAHSPEVNRVEKAYVRKGYVPAERYYLKEL